MTEYTPFDFIGSVSHTKKDLVKEDDQPEAVEKQYVPFIVNKGLSYFEDTVLHANEMNRAHNVFKDAQYRYYLGALRPRKRFSKWFKSDKNADLDTIQQVYQCNRAVAKGYLELLTPENIKTLNTRLSKGGS